MHCEALPAHAASQELHGYSYFESNGCSPHTATARAVFAPTGSMLEHETAAVLGSMNLFPRQVQKRQSSVGFTFPHLDHVILLQWPLVRRFKLLNPSSTCAVLLHSDVRGQCSTSAVVPIICATGLIGLLL